MLTKDHLPALRAARDLLDSSKEKFICLALDQVALDSPDLHSLCYEIKRRINLNLNGHTLLSTWVGNRLFDTRDPRHVANWEAYDEDWIDETGVFTLCRLAWLDRMIANIEEQPC